MTSAPDYLRRAAEIMDERGKQYDSPNGERSMGRCVAASRRLTGEKKMKSTKLVAALIGGASLLTAVFGVTGCSSDVSVASHNLSKAADNFEIMRRVVFYNGITGEYMLSIEGLCSLGSASETKAVTVTCKTGPTDYKKHFLGLSDNVTYFAEQLQPAKSSVFHYRVVFKPHAILPDIDIRTSAGK